MYINQASYPAMGKYFRFETQTCYPLQPPHHCSQKYSRYNRHFSSFQNLKNCNQTVHDPRLTPEVPSKV